MWPICTWNRFSEHGIAGRRRWRKRGPSARSTRSRRNFRQLQFEHLLQMTDSTGVIQHATYSIPNFHEGYCLDDNARALVLTVLLEELGHRFDRDPAGGDDVRGVLELCVRHHTGRFRNFLSFDRHWLEDAGSDDSVGRAAWAVGACIGRTKRRAFHSWAAQLFEPAVNAVVQTSSPRAWAFALIGIHEYLRRMSGDRLMNQHRDTLTARLDRAVSSKTRATIGRGSSPRCRTTMPSCRTR